MQWLFPLLSATAYLVTALIGHTVPNESGFGSVVWPPAGIAVAALLFEQRRTALAIFTASFMFNYWVSNGSLILSPVMALSDLACGLIGAQTIKRIKDFDWTFGNTQQVWGFLFGAVTLSTLVKPLIGSPLLLIAGKINQQEFTQTLLTWWLGDALGVLVFTPFIMLVSRDALLVTFEKKYFEYAVLSSLTILTCCYLFLDAEPMKSWVPSLLRRFYVLFPLSLWGAVRFGPVGVSFLFLAIAALATFGARTNAPIFTEMQTLETFNTIQMYLGFLASTALLTASSLRESSRSELKFRSMFQMAGVPAALVDTQGQFRLINDQFCAMTGYSRKDLLSMGFADITHPDDIEENNVIFKRLLSGEIKYVHFEKRYIVKNGDTIWVLVDSTLIQQNVGEDLTVIAIVQDITQRKMAELAAAKSQQLAEEANRAKSEFLAFMSHEIRTPLGVILGFAELLKNPDLAENSRRDFTETIHRNAIELGGLIDDMLDLSKVEAGRLELVREAVNLEDLARDIRDTFSLEAELKDIELKVELEQNTPKEIMSDHKRLRQILVNIVGNAVKYTSTGSVSVSIGPTFLPDNKSPGLNFTICDTGCGISQNELSEIFKPFGQTKRVRARKIRGTGLGLVLSRQLARLLGGDVVLKQSTPNEGSTFLVTIDAASPLVSQQTGEPTKKLTEIGSNEEPTRLEGLKVLVAEDTPDQAMLINFLLSDLGAHVEIADNGAAAVEKSMKNKVDIVLMDMQMPVLDGYDATRILRRQGFRNPIIALTAQALREDRVKALAAGCSNHLAKPFTQERLLAAIHAAMVEKSQSEEVFLH